MPEYGVTIDPASPPADSEPRSAAEVGAAVRRGCEEVARKIHERVGERYGYPPESGGSADALPVHAVARLDGAHPCCGRRLPDGPATVQSTIPADVTCKGPVEAAPYPDPAGMEEDAVRAEIRELRWRAGWMNDREATRIRALQEEMGRRLSATACPEQVVTRRFVLERTHDVSGISGTGTIADGALWPDGTASVRWRGEHPSIVFWASLEAVEYVHGHGGNTTIRWIDQ